MHFPSLPVRCTQVCDLDFADGHLHRGFCIWSWSSFVKKQGRRDSASWSCVFVSFYCVNKYPQNLSGFQQQMCVCHSRFCGWVVGVLHLGWFLLGAYGLGSRLSAGVRSASHLSRARAGETAGPWSSQEQGRNAAQKGHTVKLPTFHGSVQVTQTSPESAGQGGMGRKRGEGLRPGK